MKVTVKLPKIGMTMESATVVRFCKAPGEAFAIGEAIYEIETEKVNQEIEATAAGVMLSHCIAAGDDVDVGGAICVVDIVGH